MEKRKYLKALQLVREELEHPSRDLRLSAQVFDCKEEMYTICRWLTAEIDEAIEMETMFDGEEGG